MTGLRILKAGLQKWSLCRACPPSGHWVPVSSVLKFPSSRSLCGSFPTSVRSWLQLSPSGSLALRTNPLFCPPFLILLTCLHSRYAHLTSDYKRLCSTVPCLSLPEKLSSMKARTLPCSLLYVYHLEQMPGT